jgi:hypothetical protein
MANEINEALGKDTSEVKTSEDTKAKKSGKSKDLPNLNEDILSQIMMTGDNEAGMFAPDEKQPEEELEPGEELHEEQHEDAKLGKIKSVETKDEYKKAMAKDLQKHPDKYTIDTPRGRMTVAEAAKQGFNPETMQFDKSLDEKNEEALSRLNEQDRAKVEAFMDPSQVWLAPADADAYGVSDSTVKSWGAETVKYELSEDDSVITIELGGEELSFSKTSDDVTKESFSLSSSSSSSSKSSASSSSEDVATETSKED